MGNVYAQKHCIRKDELKQVAILARQFKNNKDVAGEKNLMQVILGSMFSGLIATEIPETIYIEQKNEYVKDLQAGQEFEVRITIQHIIQKNRHATLQTQILFEEDGKILEAVKGIALVKLPADVI